MTDLLWMPIPTWEGMYEVSDTGIVRSVQRSKPRSDGKVFNYPAQIKAQTTSPYGYRRVRLSDRTANRQETLLVHRAVALAFLSNPDGFETVNHMDGNKENNHVSNLEWVSRSQNARHGWDHGLMQPSPSGERHHNAKLTDAEAEEIRRLPRGYGRLKADAKRFGVSPSTINLIRRGKRYAR